MPFAEHTLANFMTSTVRDVVRAEVRDPVKSRDKVYRAPRIYDNLLTSQALCFNLFGELQRDFVLASRAVGHLMGDPTLEVTAIEFEHSPGRSDPRFTADRSAFDVFLIYTSPNGRGFLGVEVKYAEGLDDDPARYRDRYDEVATLTGCFVPERLAQLRRKPLEQLWRNHLLAGSLALDRDSGFQEGICVVLYPARNVAVDHAIATYQACLNERASFRAWTLESVLDAFADSGPGAWVDEVRDRYLGDPVEAAAH